MSKQEFKSKATEALFHGTAANVSGAIVFGVGTQMATAATSTAVAVGAGVVAATGVGVALVGLAFAGCAVYHLATSGFGGPATNR